MPKIRTKRSAAKRFRITAGGKIKRSKAFARHILTSKSSNRKRKLARSAYVHPSDAKRIKKLLPGY